MSFGTADRRKADVAEGVAHAFAFAATRNGNRLGVITFGDSQPKTLPPRQGRPALLGLLHTVRNEPDEQRIGATSFADALGRVSRLARRRALVVVVSDFRGPLDWRRELVGLAGRSHVLAVDVRDRREQELADVGDLWLVDPETGRLLRVDTSSRKIRERFAAEAASERDELAALLRSTGADHLILSTSGDWLRELAAFLRTLGARR
jgi:uncharacterized protein (DUF58 family)